MTEHQVTDDPTLLEALRARDEAGVDSRELGRFAVEELGIEPPRRRSDGSVPSIVMQWPPGSDFEGPGTPVWALDLGETDPDDDRDETGSGWNLSAPVPGASQFDAVFVVQHDINYEPIADPDDLSGLFNEDAEVPNPQGTHGMSYLVGVQDSADEDQPMREPVLRVDLDPETGAGALRWLPDDLVGVEEGYTPQVVIVSEASTEPLVWVPTSIARVSYETACTAAERYVATGSLPDNVTWVKAEEH
ncbi:hypothetical protein K3N28_05845 [Glycomyces sp. TRM65418]|uniref:Imm1 family immunity protein n=1 Tax=Glycomyces sp. TRM65418 TaxID=2867006 RepID=UPI001CE6432A|nr:Imm1 family immunity protein [Glycomyces sp. TRM65418]MCC3762591.1 hypothetical protein [Glycomyces sp. TRM65418]QZD56630.1 hypothetical protein K3N28_05805 [Glycomyces sp. TRM65418]